MEKTVLSWWDQANEDLKAAKDSLKTRHYAWASFQAQQAAEKGLKALSIKEFKELRKVHDLIFLAQKLNFPSEYIPLCAWLNKAYVQARYPEDSDKIPANKFSPKDAEKAIEIATKILQWLEKKL